MYCTIPIEIIHARCIYHIPAHSPYLERAFVYWMFTVESIPLAVLEKAFSIQATIHIYLQYICSKACH